MQINLFKRQKNVAMDFPDEENFINNAEQEIINNYKGTLAEITKKRAEVKVEAKEEYKAKVKQFNKDIFDVEQKYIKSFHADNQKYSLSDCTNAFYTAKYLTLAGCDVTDEEINEQIEYHNSLCRMPWDEIGLLELTTYKIITDYADTIDKESPYSFDCPYNVSDRNLKYAGEESVCYPLVVCMIIMLQGFSTKEMVKTIEEPKKTEKPKRATKKKGKRLNI